MTTIFTFKSLFSVISLSIFNKKVALTIRTFHTFTSEIYVDLILNHYCASLPGFLVISSSSELMLSPEKKLFYPLSLLFILFFGDVYRITYLRSNRCLLTIALMLRNVSPTVSYLGFTPTLRSPVLSFWIGLYGQSRSWLQFWRCRQDFWSLLSSLNIFSNFLATIAPTTTPPTT